MSYKCFDDMVYSFVIINAINNFKRIIKINISSHVMIANNSSSKKFYNFVVIIIKFGGNIFSKTTIENHSN